MQDETLEPEKIRAELDRLVGSEDFEGSERHRRFLTYIVEETLAGRADRLKAYTIATSAFNRGDDFDPQQDSIVRIEAGRLRRALDHFYLTVGRDHEVRISVPKGTYVPQFLQGGETEPAQAQEPRPDEAANPNRRAQRIFVMCLEQEGQNDVLPDFARGLTRKLIARLTRFSNVHAFGVETSHEFGKFMNPAREQTGLAVDFILSGTVTLGKDRFAVEVLLHETSSMRYIWTERFERQFKPDNISMPRDEVARIIAQRLAQPYGVLFSRAIEDEDHAPKSVGGYAAVLDFYKYEWSLQQDKFEVARSKLERVIEEDPTFSEGYACLSKMVLQRARFMAKDEAEIRLTVDRALELARRALFLAPNSSNAHHALALAYWFSGDTVRSLESYETAISLNPDDTDLMADMGLRFCFLMDWKRGVPLIENAYQQNLALPSNYRVGLMLYHFWAREYEKALQQARLIDAPDVVYNHLAIAVCAVRAGLYDEAHRAIVALERLDPDYGKRIASDLAWRNVHPRLAQDLVAASCEAGLGPAPRPAGIRRT